MTKSQRKISSNSSFLKALESDFHRFWDRPQKYNTGANRSSSNPTGATVVETLDEILYAYEQSNGGGRSSAVNFAWQSPDPEKNLFSAGRNTGFGPNAYKRTYTLFPRPGYYQHKCCGCGPRMAFCIFFFLILIAIIVALICYSVYSMGSKNDSSDVVQSPIPYTILTTDYSTTPPEVTRRGAPAGGRKVKAPPDISNQPAFSFDIDPKMTRATATTAPYSVFQRYLATVPVLPVAPSDGCYPHRCHRNAVCSNGTCRCRAGYEGDGIRVCANIDECARFRGICGCNALCVDTPGSYSCSCKPGYEMVNGSAECTDMDECKFRKPVCPVLAQCINVSGGYRCVCYDGTEPNAEGNVCWNAVA
ncbi:uncharacterized protein LOC129582297 isoform X2 [Paramacrobiotus metropolitanus]|uniref:uncharacterized protein LOC129582297 isoform X2 n=1 Tax=Paramacrobiotus metropolitanus TaxID=2943436 RepID=UPI0024462B08|nr:uncharacterized protein LOC129582297 isoform X2 [Paramacrobiotus metropolitanus]